MEMIKRFYKDENGAELLEIAAYAGFSSLSLLSA